MKRQFQEALGGSGKKIRCTGSFCKEREPDLPAAIVKPETEALVRTAQNLRTKHYERAILMSGLDDKCRMRSKTQEVTWSFCVFVFASPENIKRWHKILSGLAYMQKPMKRLNQNCTSKEGTNRGLAEILAVLYLQLRRHPAVDGQQIRKRGKIEEGAEWWQRNCWGDEKTCWSIKIRE